MKETITYLYRFIFSDEKEKEFLIQLDGTNLSLIQKEKKSAYPEWTELKSCRCPNCPVDENKNKYCPVAVNLVDVVDVFRVYISHEKVKVVVESNEREYMKDTMLQKGISSLIGIYMVTSGCPIMDKLKPMARYHLPFATLEETKYRYISMYLVAQYFLAKKGGKPDINLNGLARIYDDVRIVNESFSRRFSKLGTEDAVINALVNLDCFACSINLAIDIKVLEKIEIFFKSYFE